jgi:hypothetical protein
MTDDPDLIAELEAWADAEQHTTLPGIAMRRAAAALRARDAACGHQSNELVAKALAKAGRKISANFTPDEWAALRAATFEVTE